MNEYKIKCQVLTYNLNLKNINTLFGYKVFDVKTKLEGFDKDGIYFDIMWNGSTKFLYQKNDDYYYKELYFEKTIYDNIKKGTNPDEKYNLTCWMREKYYNDIVAEVEKKEKLIQLITGAHIFFPMIIFKVYNSDGKLIDQYGDERHCNVGFMRNVPSEEGINLVDRIVNNYIDEYKFYDLLEKDSKFKHAFEMYNESFNVMSNNVKFILLISSLESLVNKNNNKYAAKKFKDYGSLLLMDYRNREKNFNLLDNYYEKRSNYSHGNKNTISKNDTFSLRELVRNSLINYYFMGKDMKENINNNIIKKFDDFCSKQFLYKNYVRDFNKIRTDNIKIIIT